MITRIFWIAATVLLFLMGRDIAEAEPLTMTLVEGNLQGEGAELLRSELPSAQFILIGEEHGFADAPEIALALAREARSFGVVHHVLEIGPNADDLVTEALRAGDDQGVAALLADRPLAIPFVNMAEDAKLADFYADISGPDDNPLWGIDQEFAGSPLIYLESLARLAPTPEAAERASALLDRERSAFAEGDLGSILLMTAMPDDFAALNAAFSGSDEAIRIISSLAESAEIYRLYNSGANYASNARRVCLIRQNFLDNYNAAPGPAPRALFKLGASHLALGTGPLNTFDLGSLTEGLAAANGLDVLRILFVPIAGHQTSINPASDAVFETVDYRSADIAALLSAAGIAEESVPFDGYAVIPLDDLRLRLEQKGMKSLPPDARFFLLGYDYLVTTRGARAATPLAH